MYILIGIERNHNHQWARLFLAGKTLSVSLDNLTFYPCTSRPPRTEVFITEEKKEHYIITHADIYATSKVIQSLCLSMGIGTPSCPVPDNERQD